ncbi:hypothetical protein ABIA35_008831 [Catenulispora sp. MAP12-49]
MSALIATPIAHAAASQQPAAPRRPRTDSEASR